LRSVTEGSHLKPLSYASKIKTKALVESKYLIRYKSFVLLEKPTRVLCTAML